MVHPRRPRWHTLKDAMKNLTAVLLIALSATAVAELPKPAPITRYTTLWTDSPFTKRWTMPLIRGSLQSMPLEAASSTPWMLMSGPIQ